MWWLPSQRPTMPGLAPDWTRPKPGWGIQSRPPPWVQENQVLEPGAAASHSVQEGGIRMEQRLCPQLSSVGCGHSSEGLLLYLCWASYMCHVSPRTTWLLLGMAKPRILEASRQDLLIIPLIFVHILELGKYLSRIISSSNEWECSLHRVAGRMTNELPSTLFMYMKQKYRFIKSITERLLV